jgi:acetyl esterase/lipase
MGSTNLKHVSHNYVEDPEATVLNTVDVWLPESNHDGTASKGKWVMYNTSSAFQTHRVLKCGSFLHGGAWRDPLVDATSFKPTIDILSASENGVVGFASINYRLSRYPNHATKPSSPEDPSRNAEHPDHLNDVTRALIFLERIYGINGRYLLVGHSCGATLAFQVPERYGSEKVPQPACIVGSEGIYDLPSLLVVHNDIPYYRHFVVAAFGNVESAWKQASPHTAEAPAIWAKTKVLIISHSEDDELVEKEQAMMMLRRLVETNEWHGQMRYVPARGMHDEVYEKGVELARIIEEGLKSMP